MKDVTPADARQNVPTFSETILELENALVVPDRAHDRKWASGVLHADRSYCDLSRAWIRAGKSTPPPVLSSDEPIEKLTGQHLFAGHMRGHFGHFLVESTARLWAMETLGDRVDSILYLPYRGNVKATKRAFRDLKDFFRLIDIKVPLQTFESAVEVEHLFVPELGFGWSEHYAGSAAYRRFMRERLGRSVTPDGGEKLYISRARLPAHRGGVLGEAVIEDNLARFGYEIFHPEQHPLVVQIARYKAARQIVALDGSALHLAAFCMPAGGKVAIIPRRSKSNTADYVLQYQSFCGITPDIVDVIRGDWVSADVGRSDYRSIGELDFGDLFARLTGLGYLPSDAEIRLPDPTELNRLVSGFAERRGEEFKILPAR